MWLADEEMRDWNRRSNGLNEGEGLLKPGREATDGRILLPGEEIKEPYSLLDEPRQAKANVFPPGSMEYHQVPIRPSRSDSRLASEAHERSSHRESSHPNHPDVAVA